MTLRFEWDPEKALANERKHGVSFREAVFVFGDDDAQYFPDSAHSEHEDRFIIIGMARRNRLLAVGYTFRVKTRFESSMHETLNAMNETHMKKTSSVAKNDPLDGQIDFTKGRPNPFARDFYKSANLRVLDPDLLEIFPDSDAVNAALRLIVRAAQSAQPQKISARRATSPKSKKRKVS